MLCCNAQQSPPDSRSAIASARATLPENGEGCCCTTIAKSRFSFQTSLHRSRDAFASESFGRCALRKKSEGARDAARSRGPAESSGKKPASPPSLQRPARGVLRLSSARPPVAEVSIHRFGPGQRLAVWHGVTALPPKSPVTPTVAPGPMQLQPPRVGCACCTRARPPPAGPV